MSPQPMLPPPVSSRPQSPEPAPPAARVSRLKPLWVMAAPIALIPTLEGHSSTRVHELALQPAPLYASAMEEDLPYGAQELARQATSHQEDGASWMTWPNVLPELSTTGFNTSDPNTGRNTIRVAGTLSSSKPAVLGTTVNPTANTRVTAATNASANTAVNSAARGNSAQDADELEDDDNSDGRVNSYRMAMNTPNQTLRAEDGWKFIYAAVPGRNAVGSLSLLKELVQTRSNGLAVTIPVFHGNLSGVCQNIQPIEGGVIDCELKIWCQENGREPSIPESHGHNLHVRSDGQIHHVVVTLNMSGQEKIAALETTSVTVAFYQRDSSKQSAHAYKP